MSPSESTGRARTVLVFGQGSDAKAIISSVIVHTKDSSDGKRISFAGPAAFDETDQVARVGARHGRLLLSDGWGRGASVERRAEPRAGTHR